MKIPKRRFAKNIRDAFRVEPLEPRVLLSADPLSSPVLMMLQHQQTTGAETLSAAYQAIQTLSNSQGHTATYTPQVVTVTNSAGGTSTQYVYDAGVLAANQAALSTTVSVTSGNELSGSGNLSLTLQNSGIVAPTSAINTQTFSQTGNGVLDISLDGTTPGTTSGTGSGTYSQFNVSGSSSLAGTLAISVVNGFVPTNGEVFTIMTYGSASGKFNNVTGLLDVAGGLYFQVTQGATSITLTANTLNPALAIIATRIPAALDNAVGEWLSSTAGNSLTNNGYFTNNTDSFSLGSFFSGSGTFSIAFQQIANLTDPTTSASMTADVLTLSITNISATLGSGTSGLSLSGGSLNLALIAPDSPTSIPTYGWLLGSGLVTSASLSFGSSVTLTGSNLAMNLSMDLGTVSGGAANNSALNLGTHTLDVGSSVFTGAGQAGTSFTASGTMSLNVDNFLDAQGNFSVSSSQNQTVNLVGSDNSTSTANVNILTIGGAAVDLFAGTGYDANTFSNPTASNADGISLTGVNFGIAVLTDTSTAAREWVSAVSSGGTATVLGLTQYGVTLTASGIAAAVNKAAADGTVVDYSGTSLSIATGGTPIALSMAGSQHAEEQITATVTMDLNGFLDLQGTFAITSVSDQSVNITPSTGTTNTTATVNELMIGGSNVSLFAGYGYNTSDANPTVAAANADGLLVSGVNFGIALISEAGTGSTNTGREWISATSSGGTATVEGLQNYGVTISAAGIVAQVNKAAKDGSVVDYSGTNALDVPTGAGTSIALTMAGSLHSEELVEALITLDLDGFLDLQGNFAITTETSQTVNVTPSTGADTTATVNELTIGGSDVNLFAGYGYDTSAPNVTAATANADGLLVAGVNFGIALFSETGSGTRTWVSATSNGGTATIPGLSDFGVTLSAADITAEVNKAAADGSVIDFSGAHALNVTTGAGTTIALTMAGALHNEEQIAALITLDLDGFLDLQGNFAITSETDQTVNLTPSNNTADTTATANELTFGGANVSLFAGYGYDTSAATVSDATANADGLLVSGVNFGIALFSETGTGSTGREWVSAVSNGGSAAVLGLSSFGVTISATNIIAEVNKAATDGSVIDYSGANALNVATGVGTSIALTMAGSLHDEEQISALITLDLDSFLDLQGEFAITSASNQTVNLTPSDGSADTTATANELTFGGSNVSLFAGYGYNTGTSNVAVATANAAGILVSGVNFGIAVFSETGSGSAGREWVSASSNGGTATILGLSSYDVTLSATNIAAVVNKAASDGSVIDYSGTNDINIDTGGTPINFAMPGSSHSEEQLSATVTMDLNSFIDLQGNFAITSVSDQTVSVVTNGVAANATVNELMFGGSDDSLFVGYGYDTSAATVELATANAYGLLASGVNFGVALMSETGTGSTGREWISAGSNGGTLQVLGLSSLGMTISASNIELQVNQAASDGSVVNYSSNNLSIATGSTTPIVLNMTGEALEQVSAYMILGVSQFFDVQGSFAITQTELPSITLADGGTVSNVNELSIGGENVDAFVGAGYNINATNYDDAISNAIGLTISNVNFAFASITSTASSVSTSTSTTSTSSWTSLQTTGGSAGFIGLPSGYSISVGGFTVNVNTASGTTSAIDYSKTNLSVVTGTTLGNIDTITLNMTNTLVDVSMTDVLLNLSQFVWVSGDFTIEQTFGTINVDQGGSLVSAVPVEELNIAVNDVTAFIGIGGPTAAVAGGITEADLGSGAVGVFVGDLTFAFSMMSVTSPASTSVAAGTDFYVLQGTAASAGLVGMGNYLTLNLQDILVSVNQSSVAGTVANLGADPITIGTQTLNLSGAILEVSSGWADISIGGIATIAGGITIDKQTEAEVGFNLPGLQIVSTADALIIAGTNVNAFVGYNSDASEWNTLDTTPIASSAIGFSLQGLNFALAIMSPSAISLPSIKFFSLSANANYIGLVGMDPMLTLSASTVSLNINAAEINGYLAPGMFINYSTMAGGSLVIPVGSNPLNAQTLNFSSNTFEIGFTGQFGLFDLFDLTVPIYFDLTLPSLSFSLPDFSSLLDLPTLPSIDSLLFTFNDFTLPSLPNINWSTYLNLPDLNLSLPSLNLYAIEQLLALNVNFPTISLPNMPNLSAFVNLLKPLESLSLPSISLGSIDLSSIESLFSAIAQLSIEFPDVTMPSLPSLPSLGSFNITNPIPGLLASFNLGNLAAELEGYLPTTLPGLSFIDGILTDIENLSLSIDISLDFKISIIGSLDLPNLNFNLGDGVYISGNFDLALGQSFVADMYTGIPSAVGTSIADLIDLIPGGSTSPEGIALTALLQNSSDIPDITFNGVTFSATNANVFVGIATGAAPNMTTNPDGTLVTPLDQQSGLIGFALSDVNLGLGVFKADLGSSIKTTDFYSLNATANSAEVLGLDGVISFDAYGITVQMNTGGLIDGGPLMATADFAASFPASTSPATPAGYQVQVSGGAPIYLDFAGSPYLDVNVAFANIQISEFLDLQGSIDFTSGIVLPTVNVNGGSFSSVLRSVLTPISGSTTEFAMGMTEMTLGGSDLTGFFGVNGPYNVFDASTFTYVAGDTAASIIDAESTNSAAIGLKISGVDFAMAISVPTDLAFVDSVAKIQAPAEFVTVAATVASVSLEGIDPTMMTVTGLGAALNINTFYVPDLGAEGNAALQVTGVPYIDWASSFPASGTGATAVPAGFAVSTGGITTQYLNFDQNIIQASIAYADINLGGVLQLTGSMAITLESANVVLAGDSTDTPVAVTTLGIGISNAYGFIGVGGPYWTTANAGQSDQVTTSTGNGVGIAIDDLNVGVLIASELLIDTSTNSLTVGVFVAATVSLTDASLVGVDPSIATASFSNLVFELNTGAKATASTGAYTTDANGNVIDTGASFSFTPAAIDFSKSSYVSGSTTVTGAYGIPAGGTNIIPISFSTQLIEISGQANLNLLDGLVTASGDIYLDATPDGFTAFVAMTATVADVLTTNAVGLLEINSSGIAADITLNSSFSAGQIIDMSGTATLIMNSTGSAVTLTIPTTITDEIPSNDQAILGTPPFTISAAPPSQPTWTAPYVYVSGSADLKIMSDAVELDGSFSLTGSSLGEELTFSALFSAGPSGMLSGIAATGTLVIDNVSGQIGLYGELLLTVDANISSAVTLSGSLELQINTTDVAQNITVSSTQVALAAETFDLAGTATITIGTPSDNFSGTGDIYLEISSTDLIAYASMSVGVTISGATQNFVNATGFVDINSSGVAAQFTMSANADVGGVINLSGSAELQINTTGVAINEQIPVAGGSSTNQTITIPTGTNPAGSDYFNLAIKAELSLLNGAVVLDGDLAISGSGNVETLTFSGTMSIADLINNVSASGVVSINTESVANGGGVYGAITLDVAAGSSLVNIPGLSSSTISLNGDFLVEINTTNVSQTVTGLAPTGSSNPAPTDTIAAGTFDLVGNANLSVLGGLMTASGQIYLNVSSSGVVAYLDMTASVEGMPSEGFEVFGLLDINSSGIAAEFNLAKPLDLGPELSTTVDFELDLNSTGKAVTIDIPTILPSMGTNSTTLGTTAYTISAVPSLAPNLTGPYVEFEGSGNITLTGTPLTLAGQVGVVVSASGVSMDVSATLSLGTLNALAVTGSLTIDGVSGQTGVYGNLQVNGSLIGSSSSAFNLSGSFELQFNTTAIAQNVQGYNSNNSLVTVSLPSDSLHIQGYATLSLLNSISMSGTADLNILSAGTTGGTTITAALSMNLSMGILGSMSVVGSAYFTSGGSGGTSFALYAQSSVSLGLDVLSLTTTATLEINTGSAAYNTTVGGNAVSVAGDSFELGLSGSMQLLGFSGGFAASVAFDNGVVTLTLDSSKTEINFFNVFTINLGGSISSNGYFDLTGSASLGGSFGPASFNFSIGVDLAYGPSGESFGASFDVSIGITLDFYFFSISASVSVSGGFVITATSATLYADVDLLGIDIPFSYTFSWGSAPVLAWQNGSVLTLSMGHGGNSTDGYDSSYFNNLTSESATINETGTNAVSVASMGVTDNFSGVSTIVIDTSSSTSGSNKIYIGPGVTQVVDINGGGRDNTITILSAGAGSDITLGNGDNTILDSSSNSMTVSVGNGTNFFSADTSHTPTIDDSTQTGTVTSTPNSGTTGTSTTVASGYLNLNFGNGTNTIYGSSANDLITVGAGHNTIIDGTGWNDIYLAAGGVDSVTGGSQNQNLITLDELTTNGIAMTFIDHGLDYTSSGNVGSLNFDEAASRVVVSDRSASTVLVSSGTPDWGSVTFQLDTAGVLNASGANIKISDGLLSIGADGISGNLNTQVAQLSVVNNDSGDDANANVNIIQSGNLDIVTDGRAHGGVYTGYGSISIELDGAGDLMTLQQGSISTGYGGGAINLTADDMDFVSGNNQVFGTGTLGIYTYTATQNYNLGTAAQNGSGQDYSTATPDNGSLNLGLRDIDALGKYFSSITIGNNLPGVVMNVGNIDNEAAAGVTYADNMQLPLILDANTINVRGNVVSSSSVLLNSKYLNILSGAEINAVSIVGRTSEQMVVAGTLLATNTIDAAVIGTVGSNSVTIAATGLIKTTATNSTISVVGTAGMLDAGTVTSPATGASIYLAAGTSFELQNGATVSASANSTNVKLAGVNSITLDAGSLVLAGVTLNNKGAPVTTGALSQMSLATNGSANYAGVAYSASALNYSAGLSQTNYANFYLSPPTGTSAPASSLTSAQLALLASQGIIIGPQETVTTPVAYVPYASLTTAQQEEIQTLLGFTLYTQGSELVVATAVNGNGQNITFRAGQLELNSTVASAGGILTITPIALNAPILVGANSTSATPANTLVLTIAELNEIQSGFNYVLIGGPSQGSIINVGTLGNSTPIVINNNLVIQNPQSGGETYLNQSLDLTGTSSLQIIGSGHTTTIAANQTVGGSATIDDSAAVATSNLVLSSGANLTLGGSTSNYVFGTAAGDNLTLNAPGNVVLDATLGKSASETYSTYALNNLTIGSAADPVSSVTFDGNVNLTGNLIIYTTGSITFKGGVSVAGGLTIVDSGSGAQRSVQFNSSLALTGGKGLSISDAGSVAFAAAVNIAKAGNVFIQSDLMSFSGGPASFVGTGSMLLQPTTATENIMLANPALPTANSLVLQNSDIEAWGSTFSSITIGYETGGHAQAGTSNVFIGATLNNGSGTGPTFTDPVTIYGSNIDVENASPASYTFFVAGNLDLDASSNILIQNLVSAQTGSGNANIVLYSASGSVTETGAGALIGANLTVTAATGISLTDIAMATLTAVNTGSSGNIVIDQVAAGGNLTVTDVTQNNAASTGNISLSTLNGNMTLVNTGAGVTTAGSGNIALNVAGSGSALLVNDVVSSLAGTINLVSSGAITNTAVISSTGGAITLDATGTNVNLNANLSSAGGTIDVTAANNISMASSTVVSALDVANNGVIDFNAGNSIALSQINAGGSISLTATAGSISDAMDNTTTVNINGSSSGNAQLTMVAATGIGTLLLPIETTIADLTLTNTGSGNVAVSNSVAETVVAVTLGGSTGVTELVTKNGSMLVQGAIASTATGGTAGQTGNILLESQGTGANITVAGAVSTTSGNISLNSANNITQQANISTGSGTIDLAATNNIIMSGGTLTQSSNIGVIRLAAGNSIALAEITTGANVSVTAGTGNIVDANGAGINVSASGLRLNAATGIGSISSELALDVNTVSAAAAAGGVYLNNDKNLIVGDVGVTVNRVVTGTAMTTPVSDAIQSDISSGGNGNIVVQVTEGNLTLIDGVNANNIAINANGSGNILLQTSSGNGANGDIISNTGAAIQSGSGDISVLAAGNIAQNANITTGSAGTIDILAGDAITMTAGTADQSSSGAIRLEATTGNIALSGISTSTTAANVSVIADAGSISNNNGSALNISADAARIAAGSGAGLFSNALALNVSTLSAQAGSGGMYLHNDQTLDIGSVAVSVNRIGSNGAVSGSIVDVAQSGLSTTANGNIVLQNSGGDIAASNAVNANGSGNVLLQTTSSSDGITQNALIASGSGDISLLSAGGFAQNANITTGSGTVDILAADGTILMAAGTTDSSTGAQRLEASVSIDLAEMTSSGNVSLVADTGSISNNNGSNLNVSAAGVRLNAGTTIGSGSDALALDVNSVSAADAGGMYLHNDKAVSIAAVSATVNRVGSNGSVTATTDASQSDLVTTGNGNIVVTDSIGNLTVSDSANGNGISANGSGNVLLKTVNGSVDLNAGVVSGSGDISVLSSTNVAQNQYGNVSSSGTIDILASAGSITMNAASGDQSTSGVIRLDAEDNIALGELSTSGNVSVIATTGSISNNGSTLNVSSNGLRLDAGSAIGTGTNPLLLNIDTISAVAGSGGMYLSNDPAMTVGSVAVSVERVGSNGSAASSVSDAAQSGLTTSSNGNIVLQNTSGIITISDAISANGSGNILLQSVNSGDVDQNASINSGSGNISILAAGNVAQDANITTGGSGTIDILAGNTVGNTVNNIAMTAGTTDLAGSGAIRLEAANNIELSEVSSTGNVSLVADNGSISNNNPGNVNVHAAGVRLAAADGEIGTDSTALALDVTNLSAADASGIYLNNDQATSIIYLGRIHVAQHPERECRMLVFDLAQFQGKLLRY